MNKGTIVQTKDGENYYIFLKDLDETQCKVAVVEELFNEYESFFYAKLTSLITVLKDDIIIAAKYPNYFNQIDIS